jgi:hypothetical protein
MTPSLAIPTDNIYKFVCLFGLTLLVVAILSFVATYLATLDRKVRYSEVVISLESKTPRTKAEGDTLDMNRRLLEVTQDNEKAARIFFSSLLAIGLFFSVLGGHKLYTKVQKRDDQLVQLQMRKLQAEISKIEKELKTETPNSNDES